MSFCNNVAYGGCILFRWRFLLCQCTFFFLHWQTNSGRKDLFHKPDSPSDESDSQQEKGQRESSGRAPTEKDEHKEDSSQEKPRPAPYDDTQSDDSEPEPEGDVLFTDDQQRAMMELMAQKHDSGDYSGTLKPGGAAPMPEHFPLLFPLPLRVWLLRYAHRHRSILGAAGHIILTPANQLMVMGLKMWSLSNPKTKEKNIYNDQREKRRNVDYLVPIFFFGSTPCLLLYLPTHPEKKTKIGSSVCASLFLNGLQKVLSFIPISLYYLCHTPCLQCYTTCSLWYLCKILNKQKKKKIRATLKRSTDRQLPIEI
jgi:hypothetical protein